MTITPENLVDCEVLVCVSSLVHTLTQGCAQGIPGEPGDLANVMEQAHELQFGAESWADAAEEAGWYIDDDGYWTRAALEEEEGEAPSVESCEEACEWDGLDPVYPEVYEHWVVTEWLGKKLEDRGEKVDFDFTGLTVWGRTTTGQAISMDSVIADICEALNSPERIAEALA